MDETVQYVFACVFEKLGDSLVVWGVHHGFLSAFVVVGARKQWEHAEVGRALRKKETVSTYSVMEILENGGGRDECAVSTWSLV